MAVAKNKLERRAGRRAGYLEGGAEMTVRICARCHRPIPMGEEMVEKIDGRYVATHLECRRGAEYTPREKNLDTMIRDALRGGLRMLGGTR